NGLISSLRSKGMGLGLEPGSIFGNELEIFEEELKPGKLFFFYSDGLTEAMNERKEEFGEQRVFEAIDNYHSINAETLQQNVIEAMTSFRDGAEQNDDVTVVIVKAL
ncbi:MAG: PP2C family protein-serine/threonine phosphatase, partial [Bacteroidota bacterium]